MQTVEYYRKKIRNANDLKSIVHTMKVLASVSIRQFEQAAESLAEYYRTVEMGLQIVLDPAFREEFTYPGSGEKRKGQTAVILVGSGQGLCGSFDGQIISFMQEHLGEHRTIDPLMLVMGKRLASHLIDEYTIAEQFELPGSVEGINGVTVQLLTAIEKLQAQKKITEVIIIHHKPVKKGRYQPRVQYLLPLDRHWLNRLAEKKWPTNNLPQYTMDSGKLFAQLIRQYLLVSMYRAMAESLASEHTSRLNSMSIAEQKIDERLQELNNRFAEERQNAITEELLDIQSGYRAVTE